jgi:hypothetical protein
MSAKDVYIERFTEGILGDNNKIQKALGDLASDFYDASVSLIPVDDSVTNAKLAHMATKTYKGRTTAATGAPEDISLAVLKTDLGLNVFVSTTAELEAAVAAQTAGQFIFLYPGTYVLTQALTPLYAGRGGGLIGLGDVTITGAAAADNAINVIAYAGGTMEYTLGGSMEIGGGADKIGCSLTNAGVSQKVILYVRDDVHFIDNGSGIGLAIANTGTGAVRIYATCNLGTGWDNVTVTQKNADDKFHFRGISFDEALTASATNIAANWLFDNCQIAHAGMAGGHATNVVNVVNCWTIETTAVAAVDAADFPDAFNPTIV